VQRSSDKRQGSQWDHTGPLSQLKPPIWGGTRTAQVVRLELRFAPPPTSPKVYVPAEFRDTFERTLADIAGESDGVALDPDNDITVTFMNTTGGYLAVTAEMRVPTKQMADKVAALLVCCTTRVFSSIEFFAKEMGDAYLYYVTYDRWEPTPTAAPANILWEIRHAAKVMG